MQPAWGGTAAAVSSTAAAEGKLQTLSVRSLSIPWGLRRPVQLGLVAWVGDVETARDDGFLATHGVMGIVNCAGAVGRGFSELWASRAYLELDALDEEGYDILQHIPDVLSFCARLNAAHAVGVARLTPVVLIHCHAGVNRSVALSLAVAQLLTGIPLLRLAEHMAAHRPILTNAWFRRQVASLCA